MAQFEGKIAIVTGGGSGIGEAIVKELAANGATVVVADRDQTGIDRVVAAVKAAGGTATGCAIDVASAEQNAAMVALTRATRGARSSSRSVKSRPATSRAPTALT